MFDKRFRSHHDAEMGLGKVLGVTPHNRHGGISWSEVERDLETTNPTKDRCIYIHVPYCDKLCSFCNLNRKKDTSGEVAKYTDYLIAEIKKYSRLSYVRSGEFQAVYFGGGTPTILDEQSLEQIFNTLKEFIPVSEDCEITVESTLHNLPVSKAKKLQDLGVNRFSIGIQTFSEEGRKILYRTGNYNYCVDALGKLRENFQGTLGIDIIYSYPGQVMEQLMEDARLIRKLDIDSVSFYSLMIHEGSLLSESIANGKIIFDRSLEGDRRKHNSFAADLETSGYKLLELSKMVKPGRDEYRYIKIRYNNGDVLPLGMGAGGRLGNFRIYQMVPGRIMSSPVDKQYDYYHRFLGFLQYGNYDPEFLVSLAGEEKRVVILEILDEYRKKGFLCIKEGKAHLTPDGVFWGNNIAVDFLGRVIGTVRKKEVCYV